MENTLYISSYCKIQSNSIFVNGVKLFSDNNTISFSEFSKKAYKYKDIEHSKFFKMDNLSKLSFLATQYLTNNNTLDPDTAIVFSNNASSLDTDRKHQKSIQNKDNYFPSPAVFVYTLPNIAIGEISIKHQLKSENAFFISEKFNATLLHNYAKILVGNKKSNHVLCGWVNFDQNEYEAFVYLVSNQGKLPHTKENIQELYIN